MVSVLLDQFCEMYGSEATLHYKLCKIMWQHFKKGIDLLYTKSKGPPSQTPSCFISTLVHPWEYCLYKS